MIIGVGRAHSDAKSINVGNAVVNQAVQWDISSDESAMEFCCEDTWQDWAYGIKRRLVLDGTSISIENELHNKGSKILPLHWYIPPSFRERGSDYPRYRPKRLPPINQCLYTKQPRTHSDG